MIKKWVFTLLLILVCYLLQTTVFHSIALANVVPNLLLILTVSIAYLRGRGNGLVVGLICGLMLDMQFGTVIGLYGFIYMLIGFIIGHMKKIYYTEEYVLPIILVSISDLVYGFFYYIVEFLLRGRLNIGFYLIHVVLPEMVYTILISIIFYRIIFWTEKKIVLVRKEEGNC